MKPPLAVLIIAAFAMLGCSKSSDDLFILDRPILPLPIKLPITQSATCSFKKGFSVSFHKKFPMGTDPSETERVYYSASDEIETDTVAFLDLDTNAPKVRSNGGQEPLQVLYRGGKTLTLIHAAASPFASTEVYTLFPEKGVVILSQQGDAAFIVPFGEIEMGYCN
jgi:hypothetical protein